jgi:hypothetical protein
MCMGYLGGAPHAVQLSAVAALAVAAVGEASGRQEEGVAGEDQEAADGDVPPEGIHRAGRNLRQRLGAAQDEGASHCMRRDPSDSSSPVLRAATYLRTRLRAAGHYCVASWRGRRAQEEQLAKLQAEAEEEAEELAALQEDEELPLKLLSGGALDRPPIMLSDVSYGYPGMAEPLFEHAEICVDRTTRLVLLGENGRVSRS